MKLKISLSLAVAAGIAFGVSKMRMTYVTPADQDPKALMRPPEFRSNTNQIKTHIANRDWTSLKTELLNAEDAQKGLMQVYHYLENALIAAEDQKALLDQIFSIVKAQPQWTPKEALALARILSRLNLDRDQQTVTQELFKAKTPARILTSNLEMAFQSSLPYPKLYTTSLLKKLNDSNPTEGLEALTVLALMKDEATRTDINKKILYKFRKYQSGLQPYLLKHLNTHLNAELKSSSEFKSIVAFGRTQKGELWNELNRLSFD